MLDQCSEQTQIILAVACAFVLLAIALSLRVIVYMLRMAKRIRARLDSERVIVAAAARRISGGKREAIPPPVRR